MQQAEGAVPGEQCADRATRDGGSAGAAHSAGAQRKLSGQTACPAGELSNVAEERPGCGGPSL